MTLSKTEAMGRLFAVCVILTVGACSVESLARGSENTKVQGRRIYLSGIGASATPITAIVGENTNPAPGSAFPCANCHGQNGRGSPEAGIVPSDIRWSTLTKPYELTVQSGRKRAPYTERSLKRAITLGLDSSGNLLNVGMPRFRMSQSDLADLVAYLRILEVDQDPGVTDDRVAVGVILPPRRMLEMHDAVEAVLKAYFDEINSEGGIFGRRIEGSFLDYPENAETRSKKVRDFLMSKNVFTSAGSFIAGDEGDLARVFQETETPLVVAFALYPRLSAPLNRSVFYLDDGVFGQVNALVAFAARRFRAAVGFPTIICSDSGPSRQLAEAVERQSSSLGLPATVRITISREADLTADVARLIAQASFVVALVPSSVFLNVLQHTGASNSNAAFLIPGSLTRADIFDFPVALSDRIFLAYSGSQSSLSESASAEYRRLAQSLHAHRWVSEQWSALAAAKIVVEALKRTGRDLNREAFIASLEGLSNFDTGFAPPVSYGSNQRAGNTRTQIMYVDIKSRKLIPEDEN